MSSYLGFCQKGAFCIFTVLRDLRLIKVPTASTSLSQRWLSEVEAIQTRWYFFYRQVPYKQNAKHTSLTNADFYALDNSNKTTASTPLS